MSRLAANEAAATGSGRVCEAHFAAGSVRTAKARASALSIALMQAVLAAVLYSGDEWQEQQTSAHRDQAGVHPGAWATRAPGLEVSSTTERSMHAKSRGRCIGTTAYLERVWRCFEHTAAPYEMSTALTSRGDSRHRRPPRICGGVPPVVCVLCMQAKLGPAGHPRGVLLPVGGGAWSAARCR